MEQIQKLLKAIDEINIDNDKSKLDEKIRLLNILLDDKGVIASKKELLEVLKRVNWLSFEIGSCKAFESSNIEAPLVLKACEIAEQKLQHSPADLITFLRLKSAYTLDEGSKSLISKKIMELENNTNK